MVVSGLDGGDFVPVVFCVPSGPSFCEVVVKVACDLLVPDFFCVFECVTVFDELAVDFFKDCFVDFFPVDHGVPQTYSKVGLWFCFSQYSPCLMDDMASLLSGCPSCVGVTQYPACLALSVLTWASAWLVCQSISSLPHRVSMAPSMRTGSMCSVLCARASSLYRSTTRCWMGQSFSSHQWRNPCRPPVNCVVARSSAGRVPCGL